MRRFTFFAALFLLVGGVALYLFLRGDADRTVTGEKRIVLFTWEDYTDLSILEDFHKETGITVTVVEYQTMDEQISRLQGDPGAFDLIVVNESVLDIIRNAKLLRPFDPALLPGSAGLMPRFAGDLPWAVPYLWGTTGYLADTRQVPADADGLDLLWDPLYRGRIAILDDVHEAIVPLLHRVGAPLNTTDPAHFAAAEKHIAGLRENRIVFGDTFENIEKVLDGSIWIAQIYNGDYLYKARENPHLRFLLPREGFLIWADHLTLSRNTRDPEAAHRFVAFCLRPDIAARMSNRFFYANAVIDSERFIHPDLRGNAVMFPAESTLKRGERLRNSIPAQKEHQRLFNLLKAGRN